MSQISMLTSLTCDFNNQWSQSQRDRNMSHVLRASADRSMTTNTSPATTDPPYMRQRKCSAARLNFDLRSDPWPPKSVPTSPSAAHLQRCHSPQPHFGSWHTLKFKYSQLITKNCCGAAESVVTSQRDLIPLHTADQSLSHMVVRVSHVQKKY